MRGQRFNETVNIQQADTSTGFARGANSLISRLDEFEQVNVQMIQATQAKKGQEEADRDIAAGKTFKKKEAGFFDKLLTGGISTKQYNAVMETSYLSGVARDAQEQINLIETENPANIAAFNEKSQGYINGVLKGVDPSVRNKVSEYLDNTVSNSRMRVHSNTINTNKRLAVAETSEAIQTFSNESARLAREGNGTGAAEQAIAGYEAINGLVSSGDLMPDRAAIMKREINREITEQTLRREFDGILSAEGIPGAIERLLELQDNPKKGFTPDEWNTYIDSQRADIRQTFVKKVEVSAAEKMASAKEVSNLKISANTGIDINTGEIVPPSKIVSETERLFNTGALSGNERSSIISGVVNSQKESIEVAETSTRVAARLGGDNTIALSQKEVDSAWDKEISPSLSELSPTAQTLSIVNFVDSTKIIPNQVQKRIKNQLSSDDPKVIAQTSDLIDRLDSVRGMDNVTLSPEERAFSEVLTGLMQNMEPEEAIRLARQNTDPNDQARINSRVAKIKDEGFADDYQDIVNNADLFDPIFGLPRTNSVTEGQIAQEYKVLFEEHFKAGMSESAAKDKALQLIDRNWGVTNATPKEQAIKYPPEDFYQVNGSVEYIQKDLAKSINTQFIGIPKYSNDDIMLVSDQRTAREASTGKPTYTVIIKTEAGLMPLIGFRYVPDVNAQIQAVKDQNQQTGEDDRASLVTKDEQDRAISSLFNKGL